MKAVKICKGNKEKIRKTLINEGMAQPGLKPEYVDGCLIIPLKEDVDESLVKTIIGEGNIIDYTFKKTSSSPKSLREALENKGIPSKGVISSFDLIGDVAIVEIPDKLKDREKEIGKSIVKVHKNVKAVYEKKSAMEGIYRVRKLKLIWGDEVNVATYREHGTIMKIPIADAFFSPRLSFERGRIVSIVKPNENILVMFAGVGPFALVIGKHCKSCNIIGVEINPKAVEYFNKNIELNKLSNVKAIEGDVRDVVNESLGIFDRIIMPLPKDSEKFISVAEKVSDENTTIHIYTFVNKKRRLKEALDKIMKNTTKTDGILITNWRKVRDYSPSIEQIVIDLKLIPKIKYKKIE